jgi:hypothetical protein
LIEKGKDMLAGVFETGRNILLKHTSIITSEGVS